MFSSLPPGARSAIFALQSGSAENYTGQLALHFFYLNAGTEHHPWLARVEIPAWVAWSQPSVDALQAVLVAQCRILGSRPYPYLLHRAHETALVKMEEKEQVTQMIALELRRRGLASWLVLEAERIAHEKGCVGAGTWTFNWQGVGYDYPSGVWNYAGPWAEELRWMNDFALRSLRGEVNLHDPIGRHLPEAVAARLPALSEQPTLADLATHAAGLPRLLARLRGRSFAEAGCSSRSRKYRCPRTGFVKRLTPRSKKDLSLSVNGLLKEADARSLPGTEAGRVRWHGGMPRA